MRADADRMSGCRAALAWAIALLLSACASPCNTPECEVQQARIHRDVVRELDARPALRFNNISVQTVGTSVYLNGLVDTELESASAEKVARSVPGVTAVYNGLGIRGNGW